MRQEAKMKPTDLHKRQLEALIPLLAKGDSITLASEKTGINVSRAAHITKQWREANGYESRFGMAKSDKPQLPLIGYVPIAKDHSIGGWLKVMRKNEKHDFRAGYS
jgi:hypothetical protein